MINRVLLIQPFSVVGAYNLEQVMLKGQNTEAPLGLGYISSFLKQSMPEIDVEVFDADAIASEHITRAGIVNMDDLWGIIRKKIKDFKPDAVGVSCLFHSSAPTAHKTIDECKKVIPDCVTVIGGNYPSASPKDALKNPNLSYVIFSEGDSSFTQLIRSLNNAEEPLNNVDGIAYYDGEGNYKERSKEKMIDRIEDIPFPDRSNFHMDLYAVGRAPIRRMRGREGVRIGTLTASRGCPFLCTFCSSKDFWGQTLRYREPAMVVQEMREMRDNYGINCFVFNDDNILSVPREIIALTKAIKDANLGITWASGGGMQVSALSPKVIEALYESGCNYFNLAIESGNAATLKRIKKPLKDKDASAKVIETIRAAGDGWICSNFITGFPFETQEDIVENLDYCQSLDLDWKCIFKFQPFPGTADYETCVEKGYLKPFELWREGGWGDMLTLNTENFDSDWVDNTNYFVNLKTNFVNNINLYSKPEQAIRDFDYIIEIVPDQAFAYYGRGEAYNNMGNIDAALQNFKIAASLAENSKTLEVNCIKSASAILYAKIKWFEHFETFDIDLEQKIKGISSASLEVS